jgi:choice-of-anchor B domain-containing protein
MKRSSLHVPAVVAVFLLLATSADAQTARNISPGAPPLTGFGSAIAVMGEEVLVGRPGEFSMFPMPASRTGGVHVFRQSRGDEWTEVAAVTAAEPEIGDAFGQAIAADGDLLAVGAPKARSGEGAVYVFQRRGTDWNQLAVLAAGNPVAGAGLGSAVAVNGDVVLAGAPGYRAGDGAVYAFLRAGGEWRETIIEPDSVIDGVRFGSAVAANADHLVVGAPGALPLQILGTPTPPIPGSAYVFRRDGAAWEEESILTTTAEGVLSLGHAVAVSGGRVAVGAPISANGAGRVHVFQRSNAGEWAESSTVTPGQSAPGSLFGFALALDERSLLVGAPMGPGGAFVFTPDPATNGWTEVQRLSADLMGMTIFLGGTVALSGDRAIIGAPGADFFQGVGVVFARDAGSGEWRQRSTLADEAAGFDAVTGGQLDCDEGSAGIFDCTDVDLVAFLPVKDLGAERGITVNDVWGWTDSTTGKEYAIVGRSDATTFIDVSQPENPVFLGELPLTDGATVNIWRDMKVYRNHAYIVADAAGAHGIQIFDLTQLRNVSNPPAIFTETAHYDGIFSAHNIVINERTGFAYAVGSSGGGETCGGGLHMIDIRNPTEPKFAGCFSDPNTGTARTGYSHDAQCIVYNGPDAEHSGKEICFGSNETALAVSDVTDKENPVAISSATYPSVVYAHQGWVADDHRHFFQNDEGDELTGTAPRTRTLIWDIEDLDDPVLLMEYMGPTQASDHNLYVRGDFMYQSNYVSGLRIVDISDPGNPTEVGFFDTVPMGEDAPGFAGSWSNFPFFDSGTIVVTSMWEGVFILKKRDTRPIP